MEIKKVTIGSLKNPIKTGIIEQGKAVYRLYREPESINTKICFIESDKAINVEDFNIEYPILKRDKYLRIDSNQIIDEKTLYALEFEDLDKKEIKKMKKKIKEYKKINR